MEFIHVTTDDLSIRSVTIGLITSHYTAGTQEAVTIEEAVQDALKSSLGFCKGKYLSTPFFGLKIIQSRIKKRWYLNCLIVR